MDNDSSVTQIKTRCTVENQHQVVQTEDPRDGWPPSDVPIKMEMEADHQAAQAKNPRDSWPTADVPIKMEL